MRHWYIFLGSLGLAALGVWLIVLPYAAGYSDHTFALRSDLVAGGIVVVLAIWSAIDQATPEPYWPNLRHGAPTLGVVAIAVYIEVVCFARFYGEIGRFNTFYNMATGMALVLLGLSVVAYRLGHTPAFLRSRASNLVT